MICPNCKQKPITLIRYYLKINIKNIYCRHCAAELKFSKNLKRLFYIIIAAAVVIGATIGVLNEKIWLTWSGFGFLAFLLAVGIADFFIWMYGTVELCEPK